MKIDDIRKLARAIGIKPGKLNKSQLIHSIQRQEGNFDCFGSAVGGECDQHACGWREDCLPVTAKKPATKKVATKKKAVTSKKPATKPATKPKVDTKAKPKATKKKTVKKKK